MSLQKQILPLSLAVGMNTKRDPKQLNVGSLYKVENVVYRTIDSFEKRNGYRALTNESLDGVRITTPRSVSYLNSELQLFTDQKLYSYSQSIEKWVEKGKVNNTRVSSFPVLRNNFQQSNIHVATVSSIQCFVWTDTRGGIRTSVIDSATNTTLWADNLVTATGTKPKIEALDNLFFIFYEDSGAIKYRTINSAMPTSLTVEVELVPAANLQSSEVFNIKTIANKLFIAYDSTLSSGSITILSISSDGNTDSSISLPGERPTVAVNLASDAQSRLLIFYTDDTKVRFFTYTFFLTTTPIAPVTIETVADVTNLSVVSTGTTGYRFVYEVFNATSTNYSIRQNTITSAGVVGTPSELIRSVGLASEQMFYNNKVYTAVVHDSTLQSTYFIIDETGFIVSKFSPGVGGTVLAANALPKASLTATASFILPTQIKGIGVTATETGVLYYLLGVNGTTFAFNSAINYQDQVIGKNLYVTGGVLLNYDGATVTEDGFHVYPENVGPVTDSATGGFLTDGQRQYVAVYMWTDNKGQIHRSAPSLPLSFTNDAGGTTQSNEIVVPTLRLTAKSNVIIELYRTEDLGTTFYKATSTTAPTYNNKTVNTVTITDTVSDVDLLDNELLYTTGGVLDNIAAPAAVTIANYKNRLVLAGLEDQNKIAYSKILEEGKPVEWNDALYFKVDDQNGGVVALSSMDDKLIIFKRSSIYVIAGNGPNNLGEQSDYSEPEQISTDVGCISPDSVVITPLGLMFQSQKGIYLLDRGLSTAYIGADVELYNNYTITSATVAPNTNHIRFTTSNNICLVYDYLVNRWTVFSNHGGLDASVTAGIYTYLHNKELRVWIETPEEYLDNGEQILVSFETGWISFAGLQGFQRVYKMMCLGELYSDHKLKISQAINFTNAYISDTIIDSSEFTSTVTYGNDGAYGVGSPYGGDTNVYQLRCDFKYQKCESIKLRIEELQNSPVGRGLSLSAFTFEVAGKQGLFKPNQSNIFGTSQ